MKEFLFILPFAIIFIIAWIFAEWFDAIVFAFCPFILAFTVIYFRSKDKEESLKRSEVIAFTNASTFILSISLSILSLSYSAFSDVLADNENAISLFPGKCPKLPATIDLAAIQREFGDKKIYKPQRYYFLFILDNSKSVQSGNYENRKMVEKKHQQLTTWLKDEVLSNNYEDTFNIREANFLVMMELLKKWNLPEKENKHQFSLAVVNGTGDLDCNETGLGSRKTVKNGTI